MIKPDQQCGKVVFTGKAVLVTSQWRYLLPVGLAGLPQLLRAEDHLDYRYEDYVEDNNRMSIETHSVYFEQKLIDAIIAKGELTYDGITGATPTGTHQWIDTGRTGTGGVEIYRQGAIKTTKLEDVRRSISVELDGTLGNNTLTPGFAYSKESDYESYGISLNHKIAFNQKNTILGFGLSHNFDSARNTDYNTGNERWSGKQATEGIVSLSQLLTPNDIFDAAVTYGNDSGYLSDPYRQAEYVASNAGFGVGVPERRPSHRNKEILFTSLTHHMATMDASIEGSYRFYHDSYGIYANTMEVRWHQWLKKKIIFEPFFRFSEESAADFYATQFFGPFTANPNGPDGMHSSDYRLSEFFSADFGGQITGVVNDNLRVTVGYHRYEMYGLNNRTSSSMYPSANVLTLGISILW